MRHRNSLNVLRRVNINGNRCFITTSVEPLPSTRSEYIISRQPVGVDGGVQYIKGFEMGILI